MVKIRWSMPYERPQDTPVAIAGWYVDKDIFDNIKFPFKRVEVRVERFRFDTYEEARAFWLETEKKLIEEEGDYDLADDNN